MPTVAEVREALSPNRRQYRTFQTDLRTVPYTPEDAKRFGLLARLRALRS